MKPFSIPTADAANDPEITADEKGTLHTILSDGSEYVSHRRTIEEIIQRTDRVREVAGQVGFPVTELDGLRYCTDLQRLGTEEVGHFLNVKGFGLRGITLGRIFIAGQGLTIIPLNEMSLQAVCLLPTPLENPRRSSADKSEYLSTRLDIWERVKPLKPILR